MKKRIATLVLLLACLALAGCGATGGVNDNSGIDPAETKMFSTVKGDIEIPVSPKRIVSDYYLGEFLALDVYPIIASPYSLNNAFMAERAEGVQPLNISTSETALEMIIEAEPDLIVTLSEADYVNFSQIAPTVYIPSSQYSGTDLFYYIAEMLGKEAEAEAYMDALDADAAAVKEEIQEIVDGRTVSFLEVWPGEVYVMGSHFARGGSILFDLWDLKAPQPVQEKMVDGDMEYDVISIEMLPEYAGDIIFYSVLAGADSSFVEESSVWNSLPAVRNGMVKEYEQVSFMHYDPITLRGQLEFYTEYFKSL